LNTVIGIAKKTNYAFIFMAKTVSAVSRCVIYLMNILDRRLDVKQRYYKANRVWTTYPENG